MRTLWSRPGPIWAHMKPYGPVCAEDAAGACSNKSAVDCTNYLQKVMNLVIKKRSDVISAALTDRIFATGGLKKFNASMHSERYWHWHAKET